MCGYGAVGGTTGRLAVGHDLHSNSLLFVSKRTYHVSCAGDPIGAATAVSGARRATQK